jgi:predicted Zn-dependent protease with MMP-like domain
LTDAERDLFDTLLEEALLELPERVIRALDDMPLVVDDRPSVEALRSMGMTPSEGDELCGLFTGLMNTERSVHEGPVELPNQVQLYREGIVLAAGGWRQPEADDRVYEQIMVTILHEIGHRFGLEEDDLDRLGYA